jgi:hypothetical protein
MISVLLLLQARRVVVVCFCHQQASSCEENAFFLISLSIAPSTAKSPAAKIQSKAEKAEQVSAMTPPVSSSELPIRQDRQPATLPNYFNKLDDRVTKEDGGGDDDDEEENEDAAPWNDMKSNDWGDTQDIVEEKWDDFSAPSLTAAQPKSSTVTAKVTTATKTTPTASWTQEKPASTPTKNDWDTDAFFNDVMSTSSKPKLKTTRH